MRSSAVLLALSAGGAVAFTPHRTIFARAASPDNTCGKTGTGGSAKGYSCPTNLPCCSTNGFCGATSAYCGNGCQSAFGECKTSSGNGPDTTDSGAADNRCGPDFNNASCGAGQCCSAAGYCGKSEDYCMAPDCLFQFGPGCDANQVPGGQNTSAISRPHSGSVEYGGDGIYDCVNKGDIALTFDDGPDIYTSHVLDLFKKYNAKATFMVTGNNNGKGEIDDTSKPWPAIIKRMYDEGHQIASHTWSHADLCNITSAQRKNEMIKLEMAVRNVVGVFPTYMRPPYSSCTAECGCEADMADLGYHITYFGLDTQDYLNDSPAEIQKSKDIFSDAIKDMSSTSAPALVIGHDIHKQTANNLTEFMLQGLIAKGLRPVTVGDCLGDPKKNWYRTDSRTTG